MTTGSINMEVIGSLDVVRVKADCIGSRENGLLQMDID